MFEKKSKLLYLAATFLFAAAVFQIASDSYFFGIAAFGAAVCSMCAGKELRGREDDHEKEGDAGEIDEALLAEIGSPMIPEETYAAIVNGTA